MSHRPTATVIKGDNQTDIGLKLSLHWACYSGFGRTQKALFPVGGQLSKN